MNYFINKIEYDFIHKILLLAFDNAMFFFLIHANYSIMVICHVAIEEFCPNTFFCSFGKFALSLQGSKFLKISFRRTCATTICHRVTMISRFWAKAS